MFDLRNTSKCRTAAINHLRSLPTLAQFIANFQMTHGAEKVNIKPTST